MDQSFFKRELLMNNSCFLSSPSWPFLLVFADVLFSECYYLCVRSQCTDRVSPMTLMGKIVSFCIG